MRTLPEPSNFNICWTGLPLNEPLQICGELPPARINSLTIYPRASSDSPVTLDFHTLTKINKIGRERMIDIIITPSSSSSLFSTSNQNQNYRSSILQYPNHWTGGFIALRNFCVPNGTRVVTPEIRRVRDGKIIRKSEILIAGITSITNKEIKKVQRVILLNLFSILFFYYQKIVNSLEFLLLIHLFGLFIGYLFYLFLFYLGKKGLIKHINQISSIPHEFKLANIENASTASQPSQEHRYWVMKYQLKKINYDLVIQFKIKQNYQKYWSLVVYDIYGIPIQQFINIENIILIKEEKNKTTNKKNEEDENQEYFITIHLTRFPPKHIESSLYINHPTIQEDMKRIQEKSSEIIFGYGTIDITKVPIGYVLFRIVHPTTNEVIQYSQPTVKLATPSTESSIPKDVQGGYFIDVMM